MARRPLIACVAFLLLFSSSWGWAVEPKLVVAILVDQLRYDYLERFAGQFSDGGFLRLGGQGAFLTSAYYDYLPTVTAPGHATFLSGAPPSVHGIIGNDWWDKATGKSMYCCADPDVEGVGTKGPGGRMSPRNFVGSNFADEFRLRFRGRVVGVSMKDRGAILPAGKKPAGAYWFESGSGAFVTSTYYRAELPGWVEGFNARGLAAGYIGKTWSRLLKPEAYLWEDAAAGEGALKGEEAPVFDHVIHPSTKEGFESIMPTPFGNELLLEFAKAAVEGEKLGQGAVPDLLCVSFSSLDYCGHRFGPYSQEVQDLTLRLDRQIGELLRFLDGKVGAGKYVVVLTADHGVAPNPEFAAAQGMDGRRVDMLELTASLKGRLSEHFGPGDYVLGKRLSEELHFNHELLREKKVAAGELAAFIREWALGTGVYQAAYSREQLLEGRAPGRLGELVVNGYNAERGADMVLLFKPYMLPGMPVVEGVAPSGTTHGSGYAYDTHVPVFFYGPGFKAGRVTAGARVTDIVPTLSAVLRMDVPPGCVGRVLSEVLAPAAEVPKPASKKAAR